MTAYKESGIKWLGKIPAHWEVMKLKFLAKNIIGGGTPNTSNKEYWSENDLDSYLWVSIEDISKSSFIVNTKRKITKKGIENSSAKIVPPYSILYSIYASLGKVAYSDKELTTNQAILSIELKDRFYYKYYFYFLQSITKSIMEMSLSTTQNNISLSILQDFFVLVPPLEEQEKIADFLDKKLEKIDYFIAKQTKFIELLKEQKQVLINQATTKGLNKSTELKDTHISHLGKIPTHWEMVRNSLIFTDLKEVVGENSHSYTLLSLTKQGIIPRDMESGKGKFPAEFNTYKIVNPNNLVFCLFDIDETPRTVGISNDNGMITGAYNVFSIQNANPRYIYYYYLSVDDKKALKPYYTSLRKVINLETFMGIKTPLPPLEEQEKIAKYLDDKCEKIDKAINNIAKQISLIQEYKTSLIDTTTKGMLKELK